MNFPGSKTVRPVFTTIVITISVLLSVGSLVSDTWFDLFGAKLREDYFWQYFTYVFLHWTKGNPPAILIHLLLNLVIVFKVGIPVEKYIGSLHTSALSILSRRLLDRSAMAGTDCQRGLPGWSGRTQRFSFLCGTQKINWEHPYRMKRSRSGSLSCGWQWPISTLFPISSGPMNRFCRRSFTGMRFISSLWWSGFLYLWIVRTLDL